MGEPAGHRPADGFIVHLDLGLNSRPRKIARPGEVDAAATWLQCRDLQGRFIKAAWTGATRQKKYDKQKGQRPDFRPRAPPRAESHHESAQGLPLLASRVRATPAHPLILRDACGNRCVMIRSVRTANRKHMSRVCRAVEGVVR
jgi:hypothetical protein